MKDKIIALAHEVCKTNFMDYPDYDKDIELDLADALTILVDVNIGHDDDIDTAELYDFFNNKLGIVK